MLEVEDTKSSDVPVGQVQKGIRGFILGGYSEFTIFQEPDKRYKYKIKANDEKTLWFVHINNKYQGFIKRGYQKYAFYVGKKGNPNYDTNAINGLLWVINRGDNLPDVVKVYHHGKCSVCGRKLTDPVSLAYGVGPTCRERIGMFR